MKKLLRKKSPFFNPNSGFLSFNYGFGILGIVLIPILIRTRKK